MQMILITLDKLKASETYFNGTVRNTEYFIELTVLFNAYPSMTVTKEPFVNYTYKTENNSQ